MVYTPWQPGRRITAALLAEHPRLIDRQEVAGTAASVVFSSIPTTFRDLRLTIRARGTAAGDQVGLQVRMNGTASGYRSSLVQDFNLFAAGAAAPGWYVTGQAGFNGGFAPAAGATAGAFGCAEMTIPEYADSTKLKHAVCHGGYLDGTRHYTMWAVSSLASTAPVLSLSVVPSSGSWAAGTVVTLTGM